MNTIMNIAKLQMPCMILWLNFVLKKTTRVNIWVWNIESWELDLGINTSIWWG